MSYIDKLYSGAHRTSLDADTAVRVMGFGNPSGASAIALGAVRQYGLVDGLRGNIKVSDLAMRILEPSSSSERAEAIREAAETPEMFKRILDRFNGNLPNSDDVIRSFLIRDAGFSKAGADDCIASLRETFRDIVDDDVESVAVENGIDQTLAKPVPCSDPEMAPRSINRPTSSNENEPIRIPLAKNCAVELRFTGIVSQIAIDRLLQHIGLMREIWAEE
jgi:hypothetical protein